MFDIGTGELLVIAVIGLLIIGPERLPAMIRDGARWIRDLRRMVAGARRDLQETVGPELRDLGVQAQDLRELDPRDFVRRQVLEGLDDDEPAPADGGRQRTNGSSDGAPSAPASAPAAKLAKADAAAAQPAAETWFDTDTT